MQPGNLQSRQFGAKANPPQRKVTPPRTLGGDLIDARGRVQAAGRAGADVETPPWLQRSYGG